MGGERKAEETQAPALVLVSSTTMLLQTRAHHARIGAAYGRGSLRARAAAATSSGRRSSTGPSCVVCLAERRQGGSGSVVGNEGATILVAGATGGVGQILTKKLVDRGFTVKALSRSKEKSVEVLGTASNLEHLEGDIIEKHTLASVLEDVSAVCCCTGTTAAASFSCRLRASSGTTKALPTPS